ncbi:MAG: glycosyltransferase family 2 protein [Flavobacteriaceae bacterium]
MKNSYSYIPFSNPLPITEHQWDDDVTQVVSISCLTYNHELYIRDAIEGFLMQRTTFPVRIVIFEDCSTDNTAKIIKEYVAKYPNLFRAFCQPENTWGKPNRREAGKPFREERNKAKYIAVCEGDDYWTDPLKLQKQVDFLEENPEYSLVCGGFKSVNTVTGEEITAIKDVENSIDNTEQGFDITLERFFKQWLTKTLTLVYRTELYNPNDFKNYKYTRDVHLNYHLLKRGKGYYMKEVFGAYHIHSGGIFSSINENERFNTFYLVYKDLLNYNKDDVFLRRKVVHYLKKNISKRAFRASPNMKRERLVLELLFSTKSLGELKSNLKLIISTYIK